ncbi:MAG: hypothetical protein EOP50_00235 [Sphingobacteriales bacterium]|nr:MAG: hypothetical protein EOP50_00235 [Sphingobacteriales bacterium]
METTLQIPREIHVLCDLLGITPEELLRTFMNDLVSMPENSGMLSRRCAKEYLVTTPLVGSNEFWRRHGLELVFDFEDILQCAYPTLDSRNWQAARADFLEQLRIDWNNQLQRLNQHT